MNRYVKQFFFRLLGVTLLLALLGGAAFYFFLQPYYLPVFPFLLGFFFLFTLLLHTYQLKIAHADFARFTRQHMLVTFGKLVVYSLVAVIYLALKKDNAVSFVIVTLLLYIVFSFLEVSHLSRITREKN